MRCLPGRCRSALASLPSCKQLLYGCLTSDDLYEFCGDSQDLHMHDISETRAQHLAVTVQSVCASLRHGCRSCA